MWTSSKKNVLTLSKVQIKHFNLFLSGHELPQVFQWLFFTPFDYIVYTCLVVSLTKIMSVQYLFLIWNPDVLD